MKAIAEALLLLIREIPNGCVVFFTSYEYMSQFMAIVQKFNMMTRYDVKKAILVEVRGASGDVWDKFVLGARSDNGAILFAVAGGKLSEGINFSDELGRAVFMMGLPYPNKNNVELDAKMAYLDTQALGSGNQLYQSLCMHTVNQAIGRAIRHRRDYAMVFLFDYRFTQENVTAKLPQWITKRLRCPSSFQEAVTLTKTFFLQKN